MRYNEPGSFLSDFGRYRDTLALKHKVRSIFPEQTDSAQESFNGNPDHTGLQSFGHWLRIRRIQTTINKRIFQNTYIFAFGSNVELLKAKSSTIPSILPAECRSRVRLFSYTKFWSRPGKQTKFWYGCRLSCSYYGSIRTLNTTR